MEERGGRGVGGALLGDAVELGLGLRHRRARRAHPVRELVSQPVSFSVD